MRWKQYNENTALVYVEGEPEQSKVVDEFGSFKYWRDPVPTLDLDSILKEVTDLKSEEDSTPTTTPQVCPSFQNCVYYMCRQTVVIIIFYL